MTLCACGCGEKTSRREYTYLSGHNPNQKKPQPRTKLCLCGCKIVVSDNRTYATGHNPNKNMRGKTFTVSACQCGCGQDTKAHSGYLPEHEPLKLCACGCGEKVKTRTAIYRRGHWPSGAKKGAETRKGNLQWLQNVKEAARKRTSCGLRGELNPAWKGGISGVSFMVHADKKLFKTWKRPILERDRFECQHCGQQGNLHVHHNDVMMADIIAMFVPEDRKALSHDQKKVICERVAKHHVENNISGISLCKSCHTKEHERLKAA